MVGHVHVTSHHLHLLVHALNLDQALHVILATETLALPVDAQALNSAQLPRLTPWSLRIQILLHAIVVEDSVEVNRVKLDWNFGSGVL